MNRSGGLSVAVDYKSHIEIDLDKALKALGSHVVGTIKLRTDQGKDLTGAAFQQYSESYKAALRRGGELDNVDLRLTGSMMSSLEVVGRGRRGGLHYVTVGFSGKYGPAVRLRDNKIVLVGQRKITNGTLARIHHLGLGRQKPRRFFGLSKAERRAASRHALSVGIVRQQPGPPRQGA